MGCITTLQLLTTVLLSFSYLPIVHGTTEYYVIPTEYKGMPCPGEPCHTLNHYASHIPNYTWSDVAVRFLPGNHTLNQSFHVSNITNLQLTTFNPGKSICIGSASIHCTSEGNFNFKHASNVTIADLMFFTESVAGFHFGTLMFDNVANFRIHCVNVQQSESDSHYGGGCISIFINEINLPHSIQTDNHLIISKSIFKGAPQSAISVFLRDTTSFFVEISDSYITSNEGTGIVFTIYNSISLINYNSIAAIHIANCSVTHNMNGGLYFDIIPPIPNIQISIEDSIINNNVRTGEARYTGAGMTMVMRKKVDNSPKVTIKNVSFVRNEHYGAKKLSSAISLYKIRNVTFIDCIFQANRGTAIRALRSDVYITGYNSFIDNSATEGGAIAILKNSHLIVTHNTDIIFLNNYAYDVGGAIFVQSTNQDETRHLTLLTDISNIECSLLLLVGYLDYLGSLLNVSLNFTNNTGWNGGDVIYRKESNNCIYHQWSLLRVLLERIHFFKGINVYLDRDGNKSLSLLSSDPLRVCICTSGRPECTNIFANLTKYPGEPFNISGVVVGENFGIVTASVYSNFLPLGENRATPKLEELQHFQRVSRSAECTELQYTVLSENVKEIMVLTAKDVTTLHYRPQFEVDEIIHHYIMHAGYPSDEILELPVYINITLLPCPLGFMLHSSQHRCVCHSQLEEQSITCNISDQTVHYRKSMWLNASFVGNTTNGYIIHRYCPFDYCKYEEMSINLENPDAQCAFNHSDILCGGCKKGFSLALGSSQCIHCSNKYLVVLIPFILAGFVLVLFLTFLNLTVSQGTINGLIFYANIVKANQAVFFPPGDTNILTFFIAWLNLDLGIETCFADGLNGYWKTWLQCVFPVYIWIITAIIIVASHYSSMASKTFGNNSVPVLATLFLLSYAKLLRTIITVLTFTYLDYPDGSRQVVWSYDANVSYFSLSHTILFLVAVGFLSFLLLPYTGILLFKQYLQKYTKYKLLWWIVRMKPFFDAYFGPLKDKHCYWVGTVLLFRVVVLLVLAIVQDPNISLITVNIAALIYTSEQNNVRKCVQEMVPLNMGELLLYQPDNTVTDDIVHSSKWRKSGCPCVHSSWHNLCPINCNHVLPYSNEKRVKASHATVVYETQSEQDI